MNKISVHYKHRTGEFNFEMDIYTKDQIEELKERIRQGNQKLNEVWAMLIKIDHASKEYKDGCDKWYEATAKLRMYCDQLISLSYEDCLYIIGGKKTMGCLEGLGCRVCPSKEKYWEKELMDLPSGNKLVEAKQGGLL
jgi:hypothetical protein